MHKDQVWRLVRGDEPIGEIHVDDGDFPWLSGAFTPAPGFADVKPLFDAELDLIEADRHEDVPAWERLIEQISSSLALVSPDGPVADFILHIREGRASFRWLDED